MATTSIVTAGSCVLFWAGYLAVSSTVAAQNSACLIISSVGESSLNSRALSQPVTIAYSNACLQFGSGLSIWVTTLLPGLYQYPCHTPDSLVKLDLVFFPNPTTGSFQIRSTNNTGLTHQAGLFIYNQRGQLVHTQLIHLIDLRSGIGINLRFVPAGVYYLSLHGNRVKGVGEIIKINE